MHLSELKGKSADELRQLADAHGVDTGAHPRRHDLLVELLKSIGRSRTEIRASGVLEILGDGFGFLRSPTEHFHPGSEDIYVSPSQIRRFDLRTGDAVDGVIRAPKDGERYFALLRVEAVNSMAPDERPSRHFSDLGAVRPRGRLPLHGASHRWLRLIDAVCPMGLGQRCVISGAFGGEATALIAELGAHLAGTELEVLVALVGARPEEAAELSRTLSATVVAATIDEPPARLAQLAEMAVARAMRLVELGRDVVLLVDSLSAIHDAIAADHEAPDWAAVSRVKSLLACAHGCDEGGSLTLIATAGPSKSLSRAIAGIANGDLVLTRLADGSVEIDPVASRIEQLDAPPSLLTSTGTGSLREALSALPRDIATRLASEHSSSTPGSADELRRALLAAARQAA